MLLHLGRLAEIGWKSKHGGINYYDHFHTSWHGKGHAGHLF